MIKFDTEEIGKLKIGGSPKDLAVEVGALAKTIHDVIGEYSEEMAQDYEMNLFMAIFAAFENDPEEKKKLIAEHEKQMEMLNKLRSIKKFLDELKSDVEAENAKNESEIKDIRRAEFDSDEEFTNWFRGGEEDV